MCDVMDKYETKKYMVDFFNDIMVRNSFFRNLIISFLTEIGKDELDVEVVDYIYQKLPVMSKEDIIQKEYLSNVGDDKVLNEITSGSTGEPIKCKKLLQERMKLSMILYKNRLNIDEKFSYHTFYSMYGNKARNEVGDCFDLSPSNMISCFNKIQQKKIRWLVSSVTTMKSYAQMIQEHKLKNSYIKYIEVMGEVLDEYSRKYIEDIFKVKVVNHYGLRECWCIAYECKYGRLHLCDNILAYTNENDEIIVTNYILKLMPIIKYNTHDVGRINALSCECGNKNKVVELFGGRSGQIISGNRNVLGDLFFKRIFGRLLNEGHDYIKLYRVEQKCKNEFVIYITLRREISQKIKLGLESRISELIEKRLECKYKISYKYNQKDSLCNGKSIVYLKKYE